LRQQMTRLPYWSWLAAMHQSLSVDDWKQALLLNVFFQLTAIRKGRFAAFLHAAKRPFAFLLRLT
jgi:hypothetical protein